MRRLIIHHITAALNDYMDCSTHTPHESGLTGKPWTVDNNLPAANRPYFQLKEVTRAEVLHTLKTLRTDSSTGPDKIPVRFVKPVMDIISGPLTAIINNCIRKSYFPNAWKQARISPIPKIDQPTSEAHFRPISILPAMSKVFEKLVAVQIGKHTISGFRKGHSTCTVLMGIRDDLLRAMKKGEITLMNSWSSSAQLALNPTKTQAMLLSTSQMARVHSLHENRQLLEIDEKVVQYVQQSELLGVNFHEHLKWDEHVKEVSKSCYSTLSILRKIKNFTGFKLRKHLVESLVFSKSDYCDTVFHPLPEFLMKRLQRLQFAAASFVKGHYVREITDIVKLGWLPVKERMDFHLLKLVHKALHSYSWPTYLELTRVNGMRTLRSSSATRLGIPLEKGTFQDTGAKLFNSLPAQLRSCRDYKIFCKNTKSYLLSALQLK